MVITIKVNIKSIIIYSAYICVSVVAIVCAFPGVRKYLPGDSSELASWVQAIGSILAIAATWYIASAEQRERRNTEFRLAALDASTMFAEISSAIGALDKVAGTTDYITSFPEKTYQGTVMLLVLRTKQVHLRPLSEQDRVAPVGLPYLTLIADALRQISSLKQDVEKLETLFGASRDLAFSKMKSIGLDALKARNSCIEAQRLLKDFAASQGIQLSQVELDV